MNKKKSKNKKQNKQSENPVPQKKEKEQTEELDWYVQNPEYRMRCKAAIDILQTEEPVSDQSDYQQNQIC